MTKIMVEVEIFDDPELCQKQGGFCRFLHLNLTKECVLFDKKLDPHNKWWVKKCPQCKAAYQKAQKHKLQENIDRLEV